jgi:hypothetical protein
VMSLNTMPFFGKSGTSRTAARSFSNVEAIPANASGLQSKVNQFAVANHIDHRGARIETK